MAESASGGTVRPGRPADAEAIARIQTEGIEDGVGTFDTAPKDVTAISDAIGHWMLYVVHETDGEVTGFAKVGPYEERSPYYDHVGEATIFIERAGRGKGAGRALLIELLAAARERGLHKLVAKIISGNERSLGLFRACGFREVGTHLRHGRLGGEWRDVVVMERSL